MLQERCVAAPGLLAQIVVSKYCDHLPLYRQEGIYQTRHGVSLSRQNMARWMGLVADWVRPIYELIRSEVMEGGYVQVDETPIRYLAPGNGQTKLGFYGLRANREELCSTIGRPVEAQNAWRSLCRRTSKALSNPMATLLTASMREAVES